MPVITMYSTAVCPYCINAERLLLSKGIVEINKIRIDLQPEKRDEMMQKTGRRTVPQIYIGAAVSYTHLDVYKRQDLTSGQHKSEACIRYETLL